MGIRLYDFWCEKHGKFEAIVDSWTVDFVPCKVCGSPARKVLSFHGTIRVFHEYYCPALDTRFTGAKQVRDKCKELGVVPLRPGDTIDKGAVMRARKKFQHEEAEKVAEATVRRIADKIEDKPIPGIRRLVEKEAQYALRDSKIGGR